MADKTIVKEVSVKQSDDTFFGPTKIGASFQDVIDTDGVSIDGEVNKRFTLKQFYDNYLSFMDEADFVYYGVDDPTPNERIKIWIDTNHNNYNNIG